MPATTYSALGLAAWDCRVGGLDAAAAWSAVAAGRRIPASETGELFSLLTDAGRKPWELLRSRTGPLAWGVATSKGDPWAFTPALAATAGPGHLGARLARSFGVGVHVPCATAAACSTGLYSLLACADRLADGSCDRGLAGAADGLLPPWLRAGFAQLGVLATGTPSAFDGRGTGFIPAPGAGMIALVRGAAPWRLRAGVRLGDAGHETHFIDPGTLHHALQALWEVAPAPDMIIAHATGTAAGDAYELTGLDAGPWRRCERVTMKPLIGHTLGASGAVELAIALEAPVLRLWKLSLGFGGHLAAVALERG